MGRLLILIGIVLAVLWFLRWFRVTPPEQVSRVLRKVALWGVIGLVLLAVLTGRLNPLFAALGALIPVVLRIAHLLRLAPALQQLIRAFGLGGLGGLAGAAYAGQQASTIRTRYLSMRLDHATGGLDGSVLDGPFKGSQLGELNLDDLLRMLELYRDSDAQSAAVLESYLDREQGDDWRDRVSNHAQSGQAPPKTGRLSDAEARSILGVDANANAEVIRAAHRRLIQRLHPDRGGSDYLAAQINAAKRTLLGE